MRAVYIKYQFNEVWQFAFCFSEAASKSLNEKFHDESVFLSRQLMQYRVDNILGLTFLRNLLSGM